MKARRKASERDDNEIAAPMPAVISSISVKVGERMAVGAVLLSLEAMKMETAVYAPFAGVVSELLIKAGDQVDAKDLLLTLKE